MKINLSILVCKPGNEPVSLKGAISVARRLGGIPFPHLQRGRLNHALKRARVFLEKVDGKAALLVQDFRSPLSPYKEIHVVGDVASVFGERGVRSLCVPVDKSITINTDFYFIFMQPGRSKDPRRKRG